MKKKTIIITAATTAVIVFILTSAFYLTPRGKIAYSSMAHAFGKDGASKLLKMEALIDMYYMGDYDKAHMTDMAAAGYAEAVGDRYTDYFNSAEYKSMQDNLDGGYRGIGISVYQKDGKICVKSVTGGSPAQKAGIKKGDYILAVNGIAYSAQGYADAMEVIKGTPVGQEVVLDIQRDGSHLRLKIVVGDVEVEYVSSKMLDSGIGYIRVETFGNKVPQSFEKAVTDLQQNGASSLIIDLRSNPGGVLEAVVEMTDLLIGEGTITTVRDKDGDEEVYSSDSNEIALPMCVLINEASASASEIMAAALGEYGKATLVGKKTYGKGVVQGIFGLGDETGLRVTIAKYFTPSGASIDGVGVSPHIYAELPEGFDADSFGDLQAGDTQLAAAIGALQNK